MWQIYLNYCQRMGILPLKKRVNRDKCSFATNAVSRQNCVCLWSSLSMRSFAIDEPGSPVRALYATLVWTTRGLKIFAFPCLPIWELESLLFVQNNQGRGPFYRKLAITNIFPTSSTLLKTTPQRWRTSWTTASLPTASGRTRNIRVTDSFHQSPPSLMSKKAKSSPSTMAWTWR